MRFVHLSDLHLGKRVCQFSMLEDQKYIISQIFKIISKSSIDAVLIAGDVYDKAVPSVEAVKLFNDFIVELTHIGVKVFIISGNHDSAERLSVYSTLIEASGVYISPAYNGELFCKALDDEFGKINIYMLPFIKPISVRNYFTENRMEDANDMMKCVIDSANVNSQERNIILSHQFVTGSKTSESEELSIGGLDNVDADVFDAFDYVALGHIHKPQRILRDTLRYCGTPLKYSFSEVNNNNSLVIIDMKEKGNIQLEFVPLKPVRDMRIIKGSYDEVTLKANYENTNTDDYVKIILTDEDDIPNAMARLRAIYPNVMQLEYDNKRTNSGADIIESQNVQDKTEAELFSELFEFQNGQKMSDKQLDYISQIIERARVESDETD